MAAGKSRPSRPPEARDLSIMRYDTSKTAVVTKPGARKVSWARVDRDERNVFAGTMYRRCASLQKVLSLATGHDKSWISRQCNGDPTGAAQRFYDLLASLTTHPKADPSHLIVGGLVQIGETLGDLPYEEILRRLRETMAREAEAQAKAFVASFRVQEWMARVQGCRANPDDFVALHEALLDQEETTITEMALGLTLVLLGRELRRRRIS